MVIGVVIGYTVDNMYYYRMLLHEKNTNFRYPEYCDEWFGGLCRPGHGGEFAAVG